MSFRPTTLERAYQLAAAGRCRTVGDVKRMLKSEGHIAVEDKLYGLSVGRALRALCDAHHAPSEAAEA